MRGEMENFGSVISRKPSLEEASELLVLRSKLEREGKVLPYEGRHRAPDDDPEKTALLPLVGWDGDTVVIPFHPYRARKGK